MTQKLVEIIEGMDYEVRSYSGRGMYGKRCVGVVVEDSLKFMFELGLNLSNELDIELSDVRSDSLGMSTIVYFPEFEWINDLTNDDIENYEDDE